MPVQPVAVGDGSGDVNCIREAGERHPIAVELSDRIAGPRHVKASRAAHIVGVNRVAKVGIVLVRQNRPSEEIQRTDMPAPARIVHARRTAAAAVKYNVRFARQPGSSLDVKPNVLLAAAREDLAADAGDRDARK